MCQNQVAVVKDFTYLSSLLSSDGSVESESNARIAMATLSLGRLSNISQNPLAAVLERCGNLMHMSAQSYYTAQKNWPVTAITLRKLDVIQSKQPQMIEGIRWHDFIIKANLLSHAIQSPYSLQVAQRTLRWYNYLF